MEEPKSAEEYKITKVCVDSYDDHVLNGRLYRYAPEVQEGITFRNAVSFLKYMELIEEKSKPGSYQEMRSFRKQHEITVVPAAPEESKSGKEATFVVKILFRQHTSWQGTVLWCEKNKEEHFRSAMELLMLMDSAMDDEKENEST